MKKILLGLLILISIPTFAQNKIDKIIEKDAGNIRIIYQSISNLDSGDIKYYLLFSFQNIDNRFIDIKSIAFFNISEMELLVKDMKSVFKQMSIGDKVNMDWTRQRYKIILYDFSNKMHFTDLRTGGSTTISKRNLSDLLEIMSTIDFGKKTLLTGKTIDELIQ
jgi:hypothetical protein